MKKLLIVYYSWSNGNTERIARMLQERTGADIARIETVAPYTGSYDEVVDRGKIEVDTGFMPEIKPVALNPDDYDITAIGSPTWWFSLAPAVLTYVKSRSWKGRKIIPFQTNGGWAGHVIRDMEKNCPGARFFCNFKVQFDKSGGPRMITTAARVDAWCDMVAKALA